MALQPEDYACLALAVGVVGWNVCAPPGHTISEGCDRYLAANRVVTELVLASLYLHVSNRIPNRFDPIHHLFVATQAPRRWLATAATAA